MSQNTSHAVMAQRIEPHTSLDDFPTPPWATRALCEYVLGDQRDSSCWEPACNRGYMAKPLKEYFKSVHASDVHDYGWEGQERVVDFLFPGSEPPHIAAKGVDWIITNPPFRLAEQFIKRGLGLANVGVAVLVRTSFLEGVGRYEDLFSKTPPDTIAQFVERVPMIKGRHDPRASTATSYAWLVWGLDEPETTFRWIPPCRRKLQFEADA